MVTLQPPYPGSHRFGRGANLCFTELAFISPIWWNSPLTVESLKGVGCRFNEYSYKPDQACHWMAPHYVYSLEFFLHADPVGEWRFAYYQERHEALRTLWGVNSCGNQILLMLPDDYPLEESIPYHPQTIGYAPLDKDGKPLFSY